MSKRCDICGKDPSFGKRVSRLGKGAMRRRIKRKTPRRFNPNVQRVRVDVDGTPKRLMVCTRCIKKGRAPKPKKLAAAS